MTYEVPQGRQVPGGHLQVLVVVPLCPEGGVGPLAKGMQLLAMRDVNHLILCPLCPHKHLMRTRLAWHGLADIFTYLTSLSLTQLRETWSDEEKIG